jgi:hypothetical protein
VSETGFKIGLALGVAAAHGMVGRIETGFNWSDAGFRPRETYCTWNWTCPHLSSELAAPKMLDLVDINPTTTAAHAPAGENPYLARFLEPSTRIADAIDKCDDPAAARMWRECLAVNPALTPREFLLIADMKLDEGRRQSDDRPGIKIRSVVAYLIGSMASAVQGPLYFAAHEKAPHDLARDVYRAHAILARDDAAPEDRAWALGILSESRT